MVTDISTHIERGHPGGSIWLTLCFAAVTPFGTQGLDLSAVGVLWEESPQPSALLEDCLSGNTALPRARPLTQSSQHLRPEPHRRCKGRAPLANLGQLYRLFQSPVWSAEASVEFVS